MDGRNSQPAVLSAGYAGATNGQKLNIHGLFRIVCFPNSSSGNTGEAGSPGSRIRDPRNTEKPPGSSLAAFVFAGSSPP